MSIAMECRKLKRTGFLPAVLGVGLLSAMIPVVNMAVRTELYVGRQEPPLQILMEANWQMMAMLNIFLIILAACVLYHTEFADNAVQKMDTLTLNPGSIFISKAIILAAAAAILTVLESAGFAACIFKWFGLPEGCWLELAKNMGYSLAFTLPAVILMLAIGSACRNMWISLGIGVAGLFVVIIIPPDMLAKSGLYMFPFALPFQLIWDADGPGALNLLYAAGAEVLIFVGAEALYLKVRRYFV